MPLTVRPFVEDDRAAWASFVQACPDATFFHRIEWRDIIEHVFGHRTHYLLAKRGGEIVGVLPLAQVKSLLFGHSLVSLPFAVYGGAAVTDENARGLLHTAAAELARQLRVDHLELRDRVSYEPDWPHQDLFVTFRKSIHQPSRRHAAFPKRVRWAQGHASALQAKSTSMSTGFSICMRTMRIGTEHRHSRGSISSRCGKHLATPAR